MEVFQKFSKISSQKSLPMKHSYLSIYTKKQNFAKSCQKLQRASKTEKTLNLNNAPKQNPFSINKATTKNFIDKCDISSIDSKNADNSFDSVLFECNILFNYYSKSEPASKKSEKILKLKQDLRKYNKSLRASLNQRE